MTPDRTVRIVIGLVAALVLAVAASHPRIKALTQRLGASEFLSAGLLFLVLGAVFRLPSVGILTEPILSDLQPAFDFGLGWIGFAVGMQLDVRKFESVPEKLAPALAIESLTPMAITGALSVLLLFLLRVPTAHAEFVRDALVIAACAAPSATAAVEHLAPRLGRTTADLVRRMTDLDDVVALALLGLVTIVFRPDASATSWVLPKSAWLLLALGLGAVMGILTYVLVRGAASAAEQLALLLGAVALTSGLASHLALSVPVIAAIAGAVLANLPHKDPTRLQKTISDLERPLYYVFLLVAGASWHPAEWQGWLLAPAFVFARTVGKRLGAAGVRRLAGTNVTASSLALALMPTSPIAVVLIVSAGSLAGGGRPDALHWAVNAVIVGGVLTEIGVLLFNRMDRAALQAVAALDQPRGVP